MPFAWGTPPGGRNKYCNYPTLHLWGEGSMILLGISLLDMLLVWRRLACCNIYSMHRLENWFLRLQQGSRRNLYMKSQLPTLAESSGALPLSTAQ